MKKLVIGILAHVDSGKTTLSEALLYKLGEIRKQGRVDHKDAFLDTHALERDRGITIFSKQAVLHTQNCIFTLLDTPGHVDFSAETERTLQVLDYAILVINGAEGVQSHTLTLWRLLERYEIPTYIFINKSDLAGADMQTRILELKRRLCDGCMDFTLDEPELFEELAMCDEVIMDKVLEEKSPGDADIARAIAKRSVFPCYFGSALRLVGIDELIDGMDRYTLASADTDVFGARVYKISDDGRGERLTHLKVTGGTLRVKDVIDGEKVNQIRIYQGAKFTAADKADAGTVCTVTGLTATFPGKGLGSQKNGTAAVLEPVLTYTVTVNPLDESRALSSLKKLSEEDPQLGVSWNDSLKQIHLRLMGEVQLEIIQTVLKERFSIDAAFSPGGILYKETVLEPVEGVGHYEPLRHYAEAHILIEPLKPGSGVQIASDCREDDLDKNWQRLILTHLAEKTHIGVLTGSPITDIKLTLVSGKAHLKHTEGGDFRQATYRAVRHGLRCAKSVLLEPWYDFTLEVPSESVGRAMSDLTRMNAEFDPPTVENETSVITGFAPVAAMRDYHKELIGYSHGQGRLSLVTCGYRPCKNAEEVIEQIGYDCDRDTENTADSVFCSHGAGYQVRWDHVKEYMHIPLRSQKEEIASPIIQERAASYMRRLADDDELLKIFERTYGPVKQKLKQFAMRSPIKTESEKPFEIKRPKQKEYLLVDGYNIIFAWDELRKLAEKSIDAARARLTDILCNYAGFSGCEVILVFDAYKVKGNPGSVEKSGSISVVYTKEAQTADSYIEKAAHDIAGYGRVRVATSDRMEQLIILGAGALRLSASEFEEEVKRSEAALRRILDLSFTKVSTNISSTLDK